MPTNIKIIHGREFLRATLEGELDFDLTREVLEKIVAAEDPSSNYDVIVDTRKTQSVLSVTDIWFVASELDKLRKSFSGKTVIICPSEHFDSAAFFALCAQNRGLRVKAFTSFEAAIDWLVEDPSA